MTNTSIFAGEKTFNIGCRVVKWDEPNGLDFTSLKKYSPRNCTYTELQQKIKQFTVHWSVTYRANHMFNGLKARGLSVNFMIDDDCNDNGFATIYQCLDCKHAGWSQGGKFNSLGPGVEISYMPQAWEKNMYSAYSQKKWRVPPHETMVAPVHGTKLKVHLPTNAQIESLYQLLWGFSELFPNVPAKFPRTTQGFPITTKLEKPEEYVGFVSHYHLKRSKIDTAGLDYEKIEEEVASRKKWGF